MTIQSTVPIVASGAALMRSLSARRINVSRSALTDSASAINAPA